MKWKGSKEGQYTYTWESLWKKKQKIFRTNIYNYIIQNFPGIRKKQIYILEGPTVYMGKLTQNNKRDIS